MQSKHIIAFHLLAWVRRKRLTPSPCAKSDNMSSNKKSPPQGSAESKLYRARERAQYTIVVAVDICPCPSNNNISRRAALVNSASIFVSQNIAFRVALVPTAPPSPPRATGAAVAPVNHNSARLGTRQIARMIMLACGASTLRGGGSPSIFLDGLRPLVWATLAACVLLVMSRGERLYFPLFGENLHRHACPLD